MTLNQLKAFYWAAKLGTFAIAAQRLHVTQSSLSKRIAELEADIGKPLFDRSGRRALLTAAGDMLLAKAQQMLELEEAIHSTLALEEDLAGTCRFGLSELSATTWFPDFVSRLRDEHPDLALAPQVGLGRNLERLVERGELDLALVAGSASSGAIASQYVSDVKFEWMSSPSRLRRGTLLKAAQFQQHPVISSSPESGLALAFESWAASYRMKVREVIVCNSLTAIIGLTVAGVGISFLPRRYVLPLVERSLLVPLRSDPPLPVFKYSLIWRRDDTRRVVTSIRKLVLEEVDFTTPNALWTN
jgi:DNA-binding transcriptional LysR family regulator